LLKFQPSGGECATRKSVGLKATPAALGYCDGPAKNGEEVSADEWVVPRQNPQRIDA
jgi:hypothetical protein